MSVTTRALLEKCMPPKLLVRFTDDDGTGAVNDDILQQVIDKAESQLMVNLGQKYQIPLKLDNTMDRQAVEGYCVDVVRYALHARKETPPEEISALKDAAIKWSEKVAAGTLGLLGETEAASAPAAGGGIFMSARERTVSRDKAMGL